MNQKFKFQEKSQQLPLVVRKPLTVMNYKLYEKYQHSQNYFYIREINEILSNGQTRIVINYKDQLAIDEDEEYLKRFYLFKEFAQKIQLLTEYYKFHIDIARIFVEPICSILNKYYDKKRKYDYFRIAKMIEKENKLNPNKPPKGIVGERPSPANSQESEVQEKDHQIVYQNIKNIQILNELSWLKQDKTLPKEASQTINELCRQIGDGGDQLSLSILKFCKQDKMSLDNFLLYIQKKTSLHQKTSPTARQSQEQIIQKLIMKQRSKILQKDNKSYSMHKKNETKYSIGSIEMKNNFLKDQFHNISKKSNRQASTDIIESGTRLENKPQENNNKVKSKTLVSKDQLKINKFIGYLNQNSPTTSLNKISIGSTNLKQQQQQQQQPFLQLQNNHKSNQQSKYLFDDVEHQLKLKNGAITHRPSSNTNINYGSQSNRNSPPINYKKFTKSKQQKLKTSNSPQKNQQLELFAKNLFNKVLNEQKIKNSNHIKQNSNQEKVLNQSNKQKPSLTQQQNDQHDKKQHKKNKSDGRALYNKFSVHEIGCLTDRNEKETNQLFSKVIKNCSPQTQHFRRLHSEKQESYSSNMKANLMEKMLKFLAKQNQFIQQKQEHLSQIKNSLKKS